ncbi:MAG TPA: S53 family peptidase [Solirubrobacteraceae bacterium]|nr:S53 family peptidase [Solirubrobacteraceae bacterium]
MAHQARKQGSASITGLAIQAPEPTQAEQAAFVTGSNTSPACTAPANPDHALDRPGTPEPWFYTDYHCYGAPQMAAAYGVDQLHSDGLMGAGQTIVLVDSYGSPTAAHDLGVFHDTYYPGLPAPDFDQVCQPGCKDYTASNANGQSGPSAAEGWAGEANLDIEWSYAMAPLAHIVLVGVPPAETEGVQGFPALFKMMSSLVDRYPSGTVFSMSFGVTEQTFGGAAQQQTAKFDQVFKKGLAKGDTFFASSGDAGTNDVSKQQRDTRPYPFPVVGWPASSPYVTAVGGTQLMQNWRWDPQSDQPFNSDGTKNDDYFAWDDTTTTVQPAWNESWLPAATGGGTSVIYPQPSWQNGVGPLGGRGLPDVAWDAAVNGGALTYQTFFPQNERAGWHVFGGTSAASPQVAGLVALLNERRAEDNGGQPNPIGFLNRALYDNGAGTGVGSTAAFSDVTEQVFGTGIPSGDIKDNGLWGEVDGQAVTPPTVPGMPVTAGWDETTGFGTPNGPAFVSALESVPTQTP